MKIAASILENEPTTKIKDLAQQMGYENAGKFSAAFKAEMGVNPSFISS